MLKRIVQVMLVVSLLVLVIVPVTAQDDMGEMVVCDSTLVTLLFIAEYEYGYEPMVDVSTLEKGQFAPWFDAMMAMMDMEEEAMSEEMTEEPMDDMMMSEDMVTLEPGVVAEENSFCTDLRADVEAFLYDAISADMMMMSES